MDYTIVNRSDYEENILLKKYRTSIKYYTKSQIKTMYPHKNFKIVGEIGGEKGVQCGAAENLDGQPLPIYRLRSYNRFTERIVGYSAVDEHTYLAVIRNVLAGRVLFLVLLAAALAVALWFAAETPGLPELSVRP